MSSPVEISFTLNGQRRKASVAPEASALAMLRDDFELTGAKLACGEGECGACTILVDGGSVCSCIMYAADLDGRAVETVEGLDTGEVLDPVQAAFVEHGAVQCGYCTPGMVMQIKHLLAENPDPDEAAIRRGLEGNVCRCTGYSKIIDAVKSAAQSLRTG
ncbi:MAG: (2Fe-2S)-binding protein [Rhodospirillales bacterium]|jgi:carbon-monoxide dehydrogenase small subunit|nr:ferredoxin [Rhodospirillaceae bacterium]MDP6428196.1 (2Fe-2S)-binding protein [Rhodospirillales bacterium]MDP6642921.1 (2Fe-2S)-binding protein [Rhodospirillales bacterium]MDP6841468.1 (2Fe-2S)-binding protein [Rhodospirillales bacterium]|tara:strand:+ start:109 stop:588 length:480 start_codon:yes stop_codon:yes gene_type:complete